MKALHMVAFVLLVVGGLNWLLVGAFDKNLVTIVLGTGSVTNVVYVLVGLSAIYEAATHMKRCKACMSGGGMGM